MKKYLLVMIALALAGTLWVACARPMEPATAPAPKQTAASQTGAGWQQKWDELLAAGKKEGTVNIYNTAWRPEASAALREAFMQKYGISLEFSPFARGAELFAKVQAEKTAGLAIADVFGAGGPTLISTMKPAGVFRPMEPVLILPEVIDPKAWSGNRVPYLDKDKLAIGMAASVQRYIGYNTDLIKAGEITTYEDVLKPQYKGKITLNDPTVTGVGNAFVAHLAHDIWDLDRTSAYLTRLIKEQNVVIERDYRIHVESVVRGKYSIALAPLPETVDEFMRVGAPISVAVTKEGTFVSPAAGAMGISVSAPHPNATAVFANWLLTKEGQSVFSKGFGSPSLRADVSTEGFFPIMLPQPGEKLFLDSEEAILYRGQMLDVAKKIINEAMK